MYFLLCSQGGQSKKILDIYAKILEYSWLRPFWTTHPLHCIKLPWKFTIWTTGAETHSLLSNDAEVIIVNIQNFKDIPTSYQIYTLRNNRKKVEIIFYLPNFLIFWNRIYAHMWVIVKRSFPENILFPRLFVWQ